MDVEEEFINRKTEFDDENENLAILRVRSKINVEHWQEILKKIIKSKLPCLIKK